MKRLLTTLLMLLCMTACEKYDWAPQLESGEIDLTRSTIEGYWEKSVRNIVEYYDANGEFIDYERLIGGVPGNVKQIYNVYRITNDEIWHLLYNRHYIPSYIPINPEDPDYYDEKFFRKYPMRILDDGEVVTVDSFDFLAGWSSAMEHNEARITKMTSQQIIMYIKIDYKKEQTDLPKGTKYAYRKFVFNRVYPDKDFFELFADELN